MKLSKKGEGKKQKEQEYFQPVKEGRKIFPIPGGGEC